VQGKIVCKNVNWINLVQVIATLDENQGSDQPNRRKNWLAFFVGVGGGGDFQKKKNEVL
jgi:hypothetical protein